MVSDGTAGPIVVGVDGSEQSRRALVWALGEARLRGVGCLLIHAWDYGSVRPRTATELAGDAQTLLDGELAFAGEFGVAVEGRLQFGSAGRALTDASKDAMLLVVGSRGRSGLAGTLLGSVSTACVHHAACPVVVVRPQDRACAAPVVA